MPVLALLVATALPDAPASFFNYIYNEQAIVQVMRTRSNDAGGLANADKIFHLTAGMVNAVAFPLGLGLVAWVTLPVANGLARLRRGVGATTDELIKAAARALPDSRALRRCPQHVAVGVGRSGLSGGDSRVGR